MLRAHALERLYKLFAILHTQLILSLLLLLILAYRTDVHGVVVFLAYIPLQPAFTAYTIPAAGAAVCLLSHSRSLRPG